MKKVVIATGGTGGHIYPALAFAEILKEQEQDCEIVFFGSSNRMEATLIPEKGYRFIGMNMCGMNGGLKKKVESYKSLKAARKECLAFLKKEQPDACIGFGNYISVPLIMAAHKLHIKTMIHEQNSFAGKANRLLGHFVDAVVVCHSSAMKFFPKEKTRLLGNPQETLCGRLQKDHHVFDSYAFDQTRPVVVFMMGSLGSSSVSKVIDEALPLLDPSINILVAKGSSNEYTFKTKNNGRIQVVPYVDGRNVLNNCALAVTRAGATTICELASLGVCSILIPSPYVPNNHQVVNALDLVNDGGAIMLEEKDLSKESLAKLVNSLVHDEARMNTIRANAKKHASIRAAYDMLEWMEEL